MQDTPAALAGALDMAAHGHPVHPVWGITWNDEWDDDNHLQLVPACQCGNPDERKAGKHPILEPWSSTTDEAQIRAWAEQYPGCNFGVRLDGLTVIDVDPDKGGVETFNRTFAGRLERTLRVQTGSGGWHDYYAGETRSFNLKPGIEVKSGTGHQVVCPGSEHRTGRDYEIIERRPPRPLSSLVIEVGKNLRSVDTNRVPGEKVAQGRNAHLVTRYGKLRNDFDDEQAFYEVCRIVAETEIIMDAKYTPEVCAGKARSAWKWEGVYRREDLALAQQLSTLTDRGTYIFDDGAELEAIIAGTWEAPKPEYLRREDGQALFYPGRLHFLFGEDSVGKTWVSLALAAELLNAGKVVVHLDWDDDYATNVDRLLKLGTDPQALRLGLYRHRTAPGELGVKEAYAIDLERPDLVIVDVVANALGARDLDENQAGDYIKWATETAIVWARGGACVLLNDHVTKTAGGGWPRGTGAKRGSADGVAYEVEAKRMMLPGEGGELTLTVQKDRHGGVGVRRGELAATLVFDPELNLRVKAPRPLTPEERSQVDDLEIIRLLLDAEDTLSRTQLRGLMGGQTETITGRIDGAIKRGRVLDGGRGRPLEVNQADALVQLTLVGTVPAAEVTYP